MAGDDTKTQVAEARIYFAVKTREAEVAPQRALPRSHAEALRALAAEIEARDAADALVARQQKELTSTRPKAEWVDQYVVVPVDTRRIDDLAKVLGVRVQAFRKWLVEERKVIYKRAVDRYWSRSQEKMIDEYEYRACAGFEVWFTLRPQVEAPRLHNGQFRQTLYANPVGQVRIGELLKRYPLTGEADAA